MVIDMDEKLVQKFYDMLNQITKAETERAERRIEETKKSREALERIAEVLEYFLKEMDAEAERDIKEKLEGTKRIPPLDNHYYKKTPNF